MTREGILAHPQFLLANPGNLLSSLFANFSIDLSAPRILSVCRTVEVLLGVPASRSDVSVSVAQILLPSFAYRSFTQSFIPLLLFFVPSFCSWFLFLR